MLYRYSKLAGISALLVLFALPLTARAQGVGISAGANFNELGDIDAGDRSATLDNVTGWHAHLWFDLPLGPVALRPGVRYMDAGQIFDPVEADGFVNNDFIDDHVVTFLEFPLDVRLRLPLPVITPYAMAGPVVRFATDTNNEDRLERLSLAAGAGVGLEIGLAGLRIYPELKYTFGVTSFTKDEYEFGGVTVEPEGDQQLNAVMLSLGIGL